MKQRRYSPGRCALPLMAALLALGLLPAQAQKQGVPDLSQVSQTCLPTATANLLLYFAKNGYPNLLQKGPTPDERDLRTVHMLMADTDADFDLGTRIDKVAKGIQTYIEKSGYACDVEFRGLGAKPFDEEWLKENADPNTGFVLFFSYCNYHSENRTYTFALNTGHAVTLVTYHPDSLLVHDPAHSSYEVGRKILSIEPAKKDSYFTVGKDRAPMDGLMEVKGTFLDAPPHAVVVLTGALRIIMQPEKKPGDSATTVASANAVPAVAAGATTAPPPPKPVETQKTWMGSLYDFFFN